MQEDVIDQDVLAVKGHIARIVRDEKRTGEKLRTFWIRDQDDSLVMFLNGHTLPAEVESEIRELVMRWKIAAHVRAGFLRVTPGLILTEDALLGETSRHHYPASELPPSLYGSLAPTRCLSKRIVWRAGMIPPDTINDSGSVNGPAL
jgi:hypothetical protein